MHLCHCPHLYPQNFTSPCLIRFSGQVEEGKESPYFRRGTWITRRRKRSWIFNASTDRKRMMRLTSIAMATPTATTLPWLENRTRTIPSIAATRFFFIRSSIFWRDVLIHRSFHLLPCHVVWERVISPPPKRGMIELARERDAVDHRHQRSCVWSDYTAQTDPMPFH